MNIILTNNDPMNTTMVDTDQGKALYEVDTLQNVMKKVTTLRRATAEPEAGSSASSGDITAGGVVAQIEWHKSRPSRVSFREGKRRMPLSMFLHNGSGSGIFNLSRVFVGPDDKQYMWKPKDGHLELIEKTSKTMVAESHSGGLGVQEPAIEFLDYVVLTFIVMEKKRKEQYSTAGLARLVSRTTTARESSGPQHEAAVAC